MIYHLYLSLGELTLTTYNVLTISFCFSSAYKPGDFGLVPTAASGGIREKPRLPPVTRTELPPIQTKFN